MAQTEYDELLFKTDFDLSKATDKINNLKSQLSVVNTELKEASKNFNLNLVASLEARELKLKSALNSLNAAIKAEKIINNLSDTIGKAYRGIDGIAVSSIEHLSQISANWRTISRQLNAVYAQTAGLDNLYSQMVYKGQNIKQSFGTDYGKQFLANKYEKQGYTMQASNAVYDSTVEEAYANVRAQNEQRRKIEAIRLAGMTEAERDAEKLVKHQESLNKRLGTTQLQVMANYTVINKLTNAFKGLINYTVQYDEELHQLQAISAMSNASLDKTRQTIEAVAVSTEFTSLELSKAATVLAQAGLSATQIQGTLPAIAKLATATGTDLATSTDVITSTLNVYNMQVSEAEHVTNALTTAVNESKSTIPSFQTALQYAGNTASQLGISFEETAAAISAATQAGIRSKSILGTGMRAVLTEFLKPTPKLIAQLEKLGLTIDDIDVRTKGYVNVLKTLKNAGFGVEEAYKGMERRGAAFLAAQLNQTDFMDELRLKMATSTAASKANETQMEALAKQWKNFKNVLGNAATDGLQPLISLMSNLLKIINNFSQTNLGRGIFQLFVPGGGVFYAIKAFELLKKSINGLAKGLGLVNGASGLKTLHTNLKPFLTLDSIKFFGVADSLKNIFEVLTAGLSPAGWVGLTVAAGVAIYKLADALGAFTSKAEEARQKYEELKGILEEEKTEQDKIQEFQARLVRDRIKLEDPTERSIFLREILTQLPEASKYLDSGTTSVEDFRKALEELNKTNLDGITEKLQKAAEAAREAAGSSSEDVSEGLGWTTIGRDTKDLKALLAAFNAIKAEFPNIKMTAGELFAENPIAAQNINRAIATSAHPYGTIKWNAAGNAQIAENINELMRQVESELLDNIPDNVSRANLLSTLASQTFEIGDEYVKNILAPVLNSMSESFKVLDESVSSLNQSKVLDTFKDKINATNDGLVEGLDSINKTIKDLDFYKGVTMSGEATKQLQDSYTLALEKLDTLRGMTKAESYSDIAKVLGFRSGDAVKELKDNTAELKSLGEDELAKSFNALNSNSKVLNELRGSIIDAITKLELIAQEQGIPLSGMSSTGLRDIVEQNIKQIGNAKTGPENIEAKNRAVEANEIFKESLLKTAGGDVQKTQAALNTIEMLNQQIVGAYNRNLDRFNKGGEKIDPLKREMDKFFNDLDASIKQLSTTYREAIKPLDDMLARRKGIIEAASRFYGSSSGIVSAEETNLRNLEESQTGARLEAAKAKRQGLVEQRTALRESSLFKNIIPAYEEAEKGYYAAIGSKNNAMALKYQKSMDSLSSNYKKLASKDDELTKSINDLDKEIEEATYILTQLDVYKNMSAGDQAMLGVSSAMSNYVDQNKAFQTIGGSAEYLANNVISNLDSGFTSLFQNIVSGSKKAGDAFKDFGRQILETIRDIAIQMAVKQGLSALFSAFIPDTGINGLKVGETSGNMTRLASVGGAVTGPVKNRDSVNMKLMPGEYVLKKSAVDVIGRDYLDSLNDNASAVLNASAESVGDAKTDTESNTNTGAGGTVNVYVVGQEQQQAMTPSDVLVTITQDMLTGGQTKRLVKSIAMGAL